MYALWLFGPIIEQMYGHVEFAVIYVLCAAGGSVLTILAAPTAPPPARPARSSACSAWPSSSRVAATSCSDPRRGRCSSQVGTLLVLNLIITFTVAAASAGPATSAGWRSARVIGLLLAPANVPTHGRLVAHARRAR